MNRNFDAAPLQADPLLHDATVAAHIREYQALGVDTVITSGYPISRKPIAWRSSVPRAGTAAKAGGRSSPQRRHASG
jgi:hypothetical protein